MGLRTALRRIAATRVAVLLVTAPGATAVRLAVEAGVRRRGPAWGWAESPAAANALLVAGEPGHQAGDTLPDSLPDRVWDLLPHPKARATAAGEDEVGPALDSLAAALAAGPGWRSGPAPGGPGRQAREGAGGQDTELVAGLPMAERGDDRDGLRLDVLHLPLGPALPDWPAGLVVDVALQGDVVQEARVRPLSGPGALPPSGDALPYWDEPWLRAARGESVSEGAAHRRRCAAHLDSLGRMLGVAGWPGPADRARRLRDAALRGAPAGVLLPGVQALRRRVERSRTLRGLVRGLGPLPAARARELGVDGPALAAAGDAYDRLLRWPAEAERSAAGVDSTALLADRRPVGPRGRLDGPRPPSRALLDALPPLLAGAELAAARLIVASLDPDPDELLGEEAPHG